ncbi:DUF6414 family protein [Erysipelothrix anatis]|uniref:DUF6414 family protein n=1 Tax=Erysipelothrix anatis TaxID=2683713 RepID=UPI00140D01EE|nr:DUF6414 family protein [Erysipelothrix anatis]
MSEHNKIIYFDKETINNILQQSNQGIKTVQTNTSSSIKSAGEVSVEAKVKLAVPFFDRLSFLFSGKLSTSFIKQLDKTTTVSSTEISDFEQIKQNLVSFENIHVKDIENSSTFFRVAGGYLNMVKGGVDGVDVKEFNATMQSFEGYDTYLIDEKTYIRFNNTSFISNYKRNDLLMSKLDIYCIPVGIFSVSDFDFIHQLSRMETLITGVENSKTLSDYYPPKDNTDDTPAQDKEANQKITDKADKSTVGNIKLYDVLYASISQGEES